MRREPRLALGACLLLLDLGDAVRAQETPADAAFSVIECWRSDPLVVRLRVRNTATPADRDWLQFEFENRTKQPLQVATVSYHMNGAEAFDPATGKLLQQQPLASGNAWDLFFGSATHAGVLLAPGSTRVCEPVSDYATALLRVPPAGGWRVKAHVSFVAWLKGEPPAGNLGPGTAFEFRWMPPDAAGVSQLRRTVAELLQAPRLPIGSSYLLSMVLALPAIGGSLDLPALLAVRDRCDDEAGPWSPWQHAVLSHLDRAFASDAPFVAWVKDRLASQDRRIIADLQRMPHVWDPSFLPDLLRRYEAGERSVLWLLEQRGAPHRTDAEATRRLSAPLVVGFRTALPAELDKQQAMVRSTECHRQAEMIRALGWTRDIALVPLLSPWLDCRELLHDGHVSELGGAYRIPQRICDVALEAIQRLLDEDPHRAFVDAVGNPLGLGGPRLDWPAVAAVRDGMIARLKERLANPK